MFLAEHTHRLLNVSINTRHPERPFVIKRRRPVVLVTSDSERKTFSKLICADLLFFQFISAEIFICSFRLSGHNSLFCHAQHSYETFVCCCIDKFLPNAYICVRIYVRKIRNLTLLNKYNICDQQKYSKYVFLTVMLINPMIITVMTHIQHQKF